MKKSALLLAALLVIAAKVSWSQIIIQPQTVSTTTISIDNLYAVMLINGTTTPITGYLEIKVTGSGSGLIILSKTPAFSVLPGMMLLPPTIASASSKNYGSSTTANSFQQTGQLPYGDFTICYSFYSVGQSDLKGINCRQQQVQPSMPPFLVSPYNKEQINTTYPILVWHPPAPIDPALVTYSIKLTKLKSGQSYGQALKQNVPLLERSGLLLPQLPYPSMAPPLETKQDYVWQVAAFSGAQSLGITEIWSFSIGEQSAFKEGEEEEEADDLYFPRIDNFKCDGHYMTSGIIRFAYDNRSADTALLYEVLIIDTSETTGEMDSGGAEQDSLLLDSSEVTGDPQYGMGDSTQVIPGIPTVAISYGLNQITMDLTEWTGWMEDQYYQLQITDSKRRNYTLTFQYRQQ